MTRFHTITLAALAASILPATPALADHGGGGSGPQAAGPIVGTSARTLGAGAAALELELTVTRNEQRGDAVLAALAGRHIHAHDSDPVDIYTLGFAYGLTDDIDLSATLPYLRRMDIREGVHSHAHGAAVNGVAARGNSIGVGDAAIAAKWRFTGENHHGWEAALLLGLKLPTGSNTRVDDLGERFETEHQPGSGSWDPMVGLALTRPLPRGSFNASANWHLSTPGGQDTRLGHRARFAVGLSHRLIGTTIDYHHAEAGRGAPGLDGVIELDGQWEGRQRVAGEVDRHSGGTALFLSPGLRFTAGPWSATLGGSVPLMQDIRLSHAPSRYRLRFAIGRKL